MFVGIRRTRHVVSLQTTCLSCRTSYDTLQSIFFYIYIQINLKRNANKNNYAIRSVFFIAVILILYSCTPNKNENNKIVSSAADTLIPPVDEGQHFDTHELKLNKGDTFYLSTDGYADTFNGQNSKKLTTKKFKQLLLDIQHKTMQEQEQHLDNFIEAWKAGTEQVDDILVIGIRL
jgi:hypothetical protein